jgi:hypothetical protein
MPAFITSVSKFIAFEKNYREIKSHGKFRNVEKRLNGFKNNPEVFKLVDINKTNGTVCSTGGKKGRAYTFVADFSNSQSRRLKGNVSM